MKMLIDRDMLEWIIGTWISSKKTILLQKPPKCCIFTKILQKNFIALEDRLKCRKWPTYLLVRYRICRAYVVGSSSTLSKRELTRSRPSVGEKIKYKIKWVLIKYFQKNKTKRLKTYDYAGFWLSRGKWKKSSCQMLKIRDFWSRVEFCASLSRRRPFVRWGGACPPR